jgi:hypothetical protein
MNNTWGSVLEFVLKALALFGGVGAVSALVGGFVARFYANKSIEKHKSELMKEVERLKGELNTSLETHKGRLRRQELLFAKEVEAASAFFLVRQNIRPDYNHPDKDWHEAMEEVAGNLANIEEQLQKFLTAFGPVLSDEVRKQLDECISLASGNKFYDVQGGFTPAVEDAAGQLLDKLEAIEKKMIEELRH